MTSIPKYDVVIVGSGPAGSLLGFYLAGAGVEVLIIERKPLPRYKPCGGGLTARALACLPFDITPVVEDITTRPVMLYDYRPIFAPRATGPLIKMVMRDTFDHFLIQQAQANGAAVQDHTAFVSCRGPSGDLTVKTDRGDVAARLIVGADGAASRVARQLGLRVNRKVMTAVEGECHFRSTWSIDRFRGSAHFDFGVIPGGYGWVFPKKNHLSVGIGTWFKPRDLPGYFHAYLRAKGLAGCTRIKPFRGHIIPYEPARNNQLASRRGIVVGDAAGFADPLTGEGIYYALRGAAIAAKAVLAALDRGDDFLLPYNREIQRAFMPDMVSARRLSRAVYDCPRWGRYLLTRHGQTLCRAQIDVITGKTSYRALFRQMLGWVLTGRFASRQN